MLDMQKHPILHDVQAGREVVWINPKKRDAASGIAAAPVGIDDVLDAEARLARFAPLIAEAFPETKARDGLIESELMELSAMRERLGADSAGITGRLMLKMDSHLAIAGSVKARGGIYEVLKVTEQLALASGILTDTEDDYKKLLLDEARTFYGGKKMQVGSTGNLGMSIGIMSAALGYQAIVHMSADAKQWKKDLLRSRGVTVVEYSGDYGEAVKNGRVQSDLDPDSHFVDDENSRDLFLGYAVAAFRLKKQLDEQEITVDAAHPLFVYLPCGVGGAPGGVCFGLKLVFGDAAHCFFVEPTQAPCMLVGMESGLHSGISVQDIGLTGITEADGLAVGRPSGFIGGVMEPLLSGEMTVEDAKLYDYLRELHESEGIFIEPSACAAFQGVMSLQSSQLQAYIRANHLEGCMENATHIAWATGGSLVPEELRVSFLEKHL